MGKRAAMPLSRSLATTGALRAKDSSARLSAAGATAGGSSALSFLAAGLAFFSFVGLTSPAAAGACSPSSALRFLLLAFSFFSFFSFGSGSAATASKAAARDKGGSAASASVFLAMGAPARLS